MGEDYLRKVPLVFPSLFAFGLFWIAFVWLWSLSKTVGATSKCGRNNISSLNM